MKALKEFILKLLNGGSTTQATPPPLGVDGPSFEEAFLKARELVIGMESIGAILTDTQDWKKLKDVEDLVYKDHPEMRGLKLKEVREFYEASLFKLESLRDELQYITHEVKKYESIEKQRDLLKESSERS